MGGRGGGVSEVEFIYIPCTFSFWRTKWLEQFLYAVLICSTNMTAHCIKSEHRKDKFTFGRQWEIS